MLKQLQIYITEVMKGKRKGILADLLRGILFILSYGFRAIVKCRNWAFDQGCLRTYSPPVSLVISVGNIVAGGTGKTPATLLIAQAFYQNCPLAILSRGYRSPAENLATPLQISKGAGPLYPATYCGDEPYLISQNLPKALIFVGKNRRKSSLMAAEAGAKLILLDDGMQHRRLARDFDIVVLDANDPYGQGYFLPRGFLREGLDSLARANLILLNHINNHEQFLTLKKELQKYTSAAFVGTKLEVVEICDLSDKAIEQIKDKKVGIFCGIAHPEYFQKTVENLGACIVASHFLPDHSGFEGQELNLFASECLKLGAEMLLCTEKDKVKLAKTLAFSLPLGWVRTQLVVVEGKSEWNQFIKKTKALL